MHTTHRRKYRIIRTMQLAVSRIVVFAILRTREQLLHHLPFHLRAGRTIGIGCTGAGKRRSAHSAAYKAFGAAQAAGHAQEGIYCVAHILRIE